MLIPAKKWLFGIFIGLFLAAQGAEVPRIDLRQCSGRSRVPGLSIRVYPMSFLDNIFCVLKGEEQPIVFLIMDSVPGKAKKPLTVKVTVPDGFNLKLEYCYMRLISRKKVSGGTESVYEVKVPHYSSRMNIWGSAFGRISTTRAPDGKKYRMEYSISSADGHGGKYYTDLMSIAAERSPLPRIYKSGVSACGLWATSMNAGEAKAGAKLMRDMGLNIIALGYAKKRPFHDELKKAGITRCWGWREFMGDGYLLGIAPKPESVKFRNARNEWVAKGLCPEEAAAQGPYFRKHVLDEIERMMYKEDYSEHYMANWEPISWAGQGCFCPRCKKAFLKFSGIAEAELNKVWPDRVLKTYKKQWQHFRATRHADILRNIQRHLETMDRKYKRGPSWLLPEIAVANLFQGIEKYLGDFYAEYDARYYEKDLPALEPWGPYFTHDFSGSYRAIPGRHTTIIRVAEETVRQLLERNNGRRPKLFAFPHGLQAGSWVTTPEAIAFETLAFFVAGWEGSLAYTFPDGYDGRYWNGLARANRLIAAHEDFVFKGERLSGVGAVPVSPYPVGIGVDPSSTSCKYFEKEFLKGSMLRSFGFRLGKRYCIVLANGWNRGQVAASVKLPPLPGGNYRLTFRDSFSMCSGNADAGKLAGGVRALVPPLDWLFITVEPAGAGERKALPDFKLPPEEIAALKKNTARDEQLLKSASQTVEYRFDDFPSISAGSVSVRPKSGVTPNNSILTVTTPGYKGELLMARGGIFSHIKPAGIALKNGSFIGGDGTWGEFTGATNQEAFRFEKWSADGDEVTVILSGNPSMLSGMKLEKTYVFGPRNISVSVKITNPDDAPFLLNYRLRTYWRMTGKPEVLCGGKPVPSDDSLFVRTEKASAGRPFRRARMIDVFGVKGISASAAGKGGSSLKIDFFTDGNGIFFWRSRDRSEFTAEKTFPSIKLQPGQSAVFKASCSFSGGK